ncbi:MAG TPA: hypothetical protein VFR81_25995 [Longimicrobium sp.]|nr:hypothetical protein [Longimicrobium sp.]
MKKLRLELDALVVESFRTTADGAGDPGTVRAHGDAVLIGEEAEEVAITTPPRTNDPSCFETCKLSCWGTCAASCGGTCYSCPIGCTDGCTAYSCLSGAPVCCA